MNAFAAHFRELVTPKLRRVCRVQGLFVALELASFSEAFAAVNRVAMQCGSSGLPDHILYELHDWIQVSILDAITDVQPIIEERRIIADRVADDIARCEAVWRTI